MEAVYIPWLHMHQPMVFKDNGILIGNLEKMLLSEDSRDQWDARLMARAYRNPAFWVKVLEGERKHPKIAVDYSGLLLESLKSMDKMLYDLEVEGQPIGDVIGLWREVLHDFPNDIEFAGSAYAHCYFPVTPERDWESQIDYWTKTFTLLFGPEAAKRVKGFWLPEMGIPGAERLGILVKLLKKKGYEWLILPTEAAKGEKSFTYEQRVQLFCKPHIIRADGEEIAVIFRARYDFIDQIAGVDANGIYNKCLEAAGILKKSGVRQPALVVPASDGENGNIMMNEFFRSTFAPFFTDKLNEKVSSMTITDFLNEHPPEDETQLEPAGGSWVGGHQRWAEGDRRSEMKKKVERLSSSLQGQATRSEEALRALLIAETSCYVYWNSDFWSEQGEKAINDADQKIHNQ